MYSRVLKVFLIVFTAVLGLSVSGCGYKEGILVKEPVSYLWFTGNIEQAIVKIDDREPFDLSKAAFAQKQEEKLYYQIPPGKHRVVVEKNGLRLVDRNLYIGDGNIQEIQIP